MSVRLLLSSSRLLALFDMKKTLRLQSLYFLLRETRWGIRRERPPSSKSHQMSMFPFCLEDTDKVLKGYLRASFFLSLDFSPSPVSGSVES